MKESEQANTLFNKEELLSPTSSKKKRLEEPSIITKDNIFACNLRFSNLFLNKGQENDKEFMDNFELLKQETSDSCITTNFTENMTDHNQLHNDNLSDTNSDHLSHDVIKLIESPTKNNSPLKGKKIIISDDKTDSSSPKKPQPKTFNTFANYPMVGYMGMQNMPQNNMMLPYPQNSMPFAPIPQVNNGFYKTNNYISTFNQVQVSPVYENKVYCTDGISQEGIPKMREIREVRDYKEYKQNSVPIYQRYTEMSEEELIQNSKELSKDQGGCRFLQKLLDTSPSFSTSLYKHLENDFIELVNDSFGNYLIQKLIEKLPYEYIDTIISIIAPHMLNIGINPHGTRVLQRLIETVKGEQLDKFIKSFTPLVITFCNDINGNHIIQKFITSINSPKNQFIFDIIQKNIINIGLNKHGCCALQKCIEFGTEKQRSEMINQSIKHARMFLTDQYGNYVLQNIICYQNFNAIKVITDSFLKDILKLSKEKFSSNVIEKCMDYCDDETKEKILKKLANKEYIPELLMDMYGNYVIQKALQIADEPYYSIFIENIAPVLGDLRNLSFGAKLYTKFINNYPEFADYLGASGHYFDDYYEYDESNNSCYYQK